MKIPEEAPGIDPEDIPEFSPLNLLLKKQSTPSKCPSELSLENIKSPDHSILGDLSTGSKITMKELIRSGFKSTFKCFI